jgi:predicted nucleotidyltransferase
LSLLGKSSQVKKKRDIKLSFYKKIGICKVIVFGSVADGVCREMFDLDILIMPLENSQYWDFRYDLEEAVDLPIDLYSA